MLAALLLNEWDAPAGAIGPARRPQLVWTPEIKPEWLQKRLTQPIQWALVAVRVEVLTDGSVGTVEFLRPTNSVVLETYIRTLAGQQLYRPAVEGNRYVVAKADFVFRLEPH